MVMLGHTRKTAPEGAESSAFPPTAASLRPPPHFKIPSMVPVENRRDYRRPRPHVDPPRLLPSPAGRSSPASRYSGSRELSSAPRRIKKASRVRVMPVPYLQHWTASPEARRTATSQFPRARSDEKGRVEPSPSCSTSDSGLRPPSRKWSHCLRDPPTGVRGRPGFLRLREHRDPCRCQQPQAGGDLGSGTIRRQPRLLPATHADRRASAGPANPSPTTSRSRNLTNSPVVDALETAMPRRTTRARTGQNPLAARKPARLRIRKPTHPSCTAPPRTLRRDARPCDEVDMQHLVSRGSRSLHLAHEIRLGELLLHDGPPASRPYTSSMMRCSKVDREPFVEPEVAPRSRWSRGLPDHECAKLVRNPATRATCPPPGPSARRGTVRHGFSIPPKGGTTRQHDQVRRRPHRYGPVTAPSALCTMRSVSMNSAVRGRRHACARPRCPHALRNGAGNSNVGRRAKAAIK